MLKLRNLSVQPLHILVCCHDCSALCTLHAAVFTVLFVLPRINFPHSHTDNWPSFSLMRSIFSSHLFTLDIINVNACEGVVDFLDKEIRGLSPSIFGILKAHDRAAVSLMINANTLPTAIYVYICLDSILLLLALWCLKQRNNEFSSRAAMTCEIFTMLRAMTVSHGLPMASAPAQTLGRSPFE